MTRQTDLVKAGYKVEIEATEIRGMGYCNKLETGQRWTYPDRMDGMCYQALNSMMPTLFMLAQGGTHPRATVTGEKDVVAVCCPDPLRPVVFTLTRGKAHMIPRRDTSGRERQDVF